MTTPSLYEIAATYRAEADALADLDLDPQTLADTLEAQSGALELKAQNVVFVARNLQVTAEAIRAAERQMADRRKAIEARAEHLLAYVLSAMQLAQVKSIECPHFKIGIQNNPAAVELYEPALLPQSFMRQPEPPPPAPDKTAIKEALKAGRDVPGARLTQGQRLEIK